MYPDQELVGWPNMSARNEKIISIVYVCTLNLFVGVLSIVVDTTRRMWYELVGLGDDQS